MSKRKYKAIACALAFAGVTTLSGASVWASPTEEVAVVEKNVEGTGQEAQAKRLPTPEEVEALASGKAPDLLQSIEANMQDSGAKAEKKEDTAQDDENLPDFEEDLPMVKPLPPIEEIVLPPEVMTVKPEGYNPLKEEIKTPEGEAAAETKKEDKKEDKKESKPVDSAELEMKKWSAFRPDEKIITETLEKLKGRMIVDVNVVGASEATMSFAKKAVITRGGDYFSAAVINKDRDALFDVGYFYDLYPTFEIVPEGVIVTYNLLENPILTGVEIKGNTVEKTEDLYNLITVKKGEVLNSKLLHENLRAIEELYHTDGYVLVKLSGIEVGRDGKLNLSINEGKLEGYTVKGNTKTKDRVILREMRQKVGEPFNAKLARRGMQRVYNLGFFEDVNIKLNPGVEPNAVVLEVDVVEKRTGSFMIGAGYSTRDGFLGMVGVGDRNFRGIGDAVNFTYEFSGDDSDARGVQLAYRKPWIDKKETAVTIKLYNRTFQYDDYNTDGDEIEEFMRRHKGIDLAFSRPQTEYTSNHILFRHRNDTYKKNESGLDRSTPAYAKWRDDNFGITRSIIFSHITDTRDNIYDPTDGMKGTWTFEYAGLGGKFNYRKYSYDHSQYVKIGRDHVFAWRASYGKGDGHMPEANQYLLGGQETIRGYRDDSFRGDSMYLLSMEYRFPIVKKVRGAIFTDAGAAWFGGWAPKGTHTSIGFGVSLDTPVGPIRVDLGHGSHGNRVHFTVGGAF